MLNVISLIVAIFGLMGLLFSLRQSNRARLRQFEEKYVERYWSILDGLSLDALKLSGREVGQDDEKVIRKYINLCEDELQIRKNGYISDATYEEWADGMIGQFKQPMFKEVWEHVQAEEAHNEPGAFPYANLRRLLQDGEFRSGSPVDPLRMRAPVKAIRGLKGIRGA